MLLLRHGECHQNYATDPALTSRGRLEVAARARHMRAAGIDRIFHSPKRRAAETAQVIARLISPREIRAMDPLREIHPGCLAVGDDPADRARAEFVSSEFFAEWAGDSRLLVVSHHNLLLFTLRRLIPGLQGDPFAAYGALVEVGCVVDGAFCHESKPLPPC